MKPVTLTFDSFKKVMTLIAYLENSSSSMIRMLNETPSLGQSRLHQIDFYKGILVGIRNRSQRLRKEWSDVASDQNALFEKIANINLTYENLQRDFKELYEITEYIFEVDYFIDTEGTLIKRIKTKVRDDN